MFVTDTTNPPAPRHHRLQFRQFDLVVVADAFTAFVCFAIASSYLQSHSRHHIGFFTAVLVAAVTSAPLLLRTRFPLISWAAAALTIVGTTVLIRPHLLVTDTYLPTSVLVYGLCLYSVTVRCKVRIVAAAAIVTIVGAGFIDWGAFAAAFFLTAIPLVLGAAMVTYRNSERRVAEQERRLEEQERRHSSERALLEERQRIARELHDVVAHHMSVIAIQAEAAPYKTPAPPPELVESFAGIRTSALTGLAELRRVLGVLRTDRPDTGPQPSLADLGGLLDSARGGGLTVTVTTDGDPALVPEGVDLSAYRIVQEALSNAMRHAPGSHVAVGVTYRARNLELDIRNDAGRGSHAGRAGETGENGGMDKVGSGHGLIGMRERTAMLGGTLSAAPARDGGFRVFAVLPLSTGDDGDGV